jgi:hypothetical protein
MMYQSDPESLLSWVGAHNVENLPAWVEEQIYDVCHELQQLRAETDPQIGDTAQIVEPYARQVGKIATLWKNGKRMRIKFVGYELEARRFLDGWFVTDTLGHKTKAKVLLGWTE